MTQDGKEDIGENWVPTLLYKESIEGMKTIADNSIDMILCDLPYG